MKPPALSFTQNERGSRKRVSNSLRKLLRQKKCRGMWNRVEKEKKYRNRSIRPEISTEKAYEEARQSRQGDK